ncbi:unnamed protein product [Urochloa decumbens]|uniref:Uncharacterized protein n=1 Tax=Urochloa decumbens TaxID=240449 RepID=A0ABC9EJG5_9POAL
MESTVMTTFSLKPGQCHGSCHLPIALSQPIGKCSHRPRICQRQQQYAVLRCRKRHQQPEGTLHDDHDRIDDDRPNKNPARFHPSIWGDFFLHYSNPIACFPQQQVRMAERADRLKKEVEQMIERSSSCSLLQRLHLIHVLQRLCLDHLFEDEINGLLTQIKNADVSGCDLHTVALWFYLLRNHGCRVSPDVFIKFKDEDGSFESNCSEDLLILYNAGYFGTHGETILDEAVSFSKKCLETTMPHLDPEGSLAREITCALETPLSRRVRIYELKHYISIFEKETTVHETILELAKVNSNLMQLHFQRELNIITRIVECYFWMVGAYFEPRYARARIILTLVMAIISIVDDIYDVYGTSEECEQFTRCIESWDPKVGKGLPENLKIILECILATYKDIEHELETEHKYRMSYLKFVTIDWVRAYTTEVKWRDQRYVPATVEEHLKLSVRSGACHLLSCASFVGMDDVATRESFEWVSSMPKIVHSLCVILRLLDDPKSYEREQRALHVASTIDSCMKEHNVSMELALKKIKEMTEDSWKSLNEEWLKTDKAQTKELLERIFNLARSMEFFYKQEDAYTNSYIIKDTIKSLFVDSY